ncbi:uncharacterized protein DUF222 [Herbihabitans rhizosphaerae]|uniref:Uncharacterized protein DUF222 n=1 Tax=Herbihabitans rhizosphaerae TaxID=1872711 RepID=A0A4Q7L273_9PSEU|nr:HNH endonuclease signature motif containing protein [Herbihabitans rhizosphaerae]RZS43648.1 uncharacterized protein DUF222 [Herbihabitans rhizosphaerae]
MFETVGDVLDEIIALQRMRREIDGRLIRLLDEFGRAYPSRDDGRPGMASVELAAALKMDQPQADYRIETAQRMVSRLPDTVTAIEKGSIDGYTGEKILHIVSSLEGEQAQAVEMAVLRDCAERTHKQLVDRARRQVVKVDPEGAERRRQVRLRDRAVHHEPLEDGIGELLITGASDRTMAAYALIDRCARQIKRAGDDRTLAQIRADVALDLLLGKDNSRRKVVVYVTVPATVLAGISDQPGELAGYGPLTAQACRELADQHSTWRRMLTDPIDNTVLNLGRKRYPSAALAEHVQVRDKTCRGHGCHRPAVSCEIDHTLAYGDGGETWDGNLGPFCEQHHHAKHDNGWTVEQPKPGHFTWTSPLGRTYDLPPDEPPF